MRFEIQVLAFCCLPSDENKLRDRVRVCVVVFKQSTQLG